MEELGAWAILVPILITATIAFSIVLNNWLRMRHGYPLENDDGTIVHKGVAAEQQQLLAENDRLSREVADLHARLHVLERIATDPAQRTVREIEALRRGDA